MIDTHTHLYSKEFETDRDLVLENAIRVGVRQFILPAIDSKTHADMHQLKNKYPNIVHLMMGLHPCHVENISLENEYLNITYSTKGGLAKKVELKEFDDFQYKKQYNVLYAFKC